MKIDYILTEKPAQLAQNLVVRQSRDKQSNAINCIRKYVHILEARARMLSITITRDACNMCKALKALSISTLARAGRVGT